MQKLTTFKIVAPSIEAGFSLQVFQSSVDSLKGICEIQSENCSCQQKVCNVIGRCSQKMSAVGFEPTRFSPPELESGALDRSAKLTLWIFLIVGPRRSAPLLVQLLFFFWVGNSSLRIFGHEVAFRISQRLLGGFELQAGPQTQSSKCCSGQPNSHQAFRGVWASSRPPNSIFQMLLSCGLEHP